MNIAASSPDDDGTESQDSVLVEFTDVHIDFTPRPIRDAVLEHLPRWLREAAEARRRAAPKSRDSGALAHCLLGQARVLLALQRHREAIPKVTEAEALYREIGTHSGIADCFSVAAEIHRGLGEIDAALDYLRKEEEIRRRFAA